MAQWLRVRVDFAEDSTLDRCLITSSLPASGAPLPFPGLHRKRLPTSTDQQVIKDKKVGWVHLSS